jgi:hypothetical protein
LKNGKEKKLDKNIDCIPKNHPQRFKGLLLGVNPFLSFFAFLAIFGKKNSQTPERLSLCKK